MDAREEGRLEGKYGQLWEAHGCVLYITREALSFKGRLFLIVEIKGILFNGIYRQPIIT